MIARTLSAVAATALAVTALAGCRTNVGVAANVDGHTISESQVSSYVTAQAQPLTSTNQTTGQTNSIAPKPFVLNILIKEQFYRELLARTPGGVPSAGRISAMINSYLRGRTEQQAVEALGVHGYTPSFAHEILVYSELGQTLDQDVQNGVDVNTIARKLKFPVTVNPRYGSWNARYFTLSTAPSAGLPGFVSLQPSPTTGQGGPYAG